MLHKVANLCHTENTNKERNAMQTLVICPNHEGNFDCTPFCALCEGDQEFYSNEIQADENTKGEIYAYFYQGVKIKVENKGFSVWKSALGYSLFAEDNSKSYFDTLEQAKVWIDLNRPGA